MARYNLAIILAVMVLPAMGMGREGVLRKLNNQLIEASKGGLLDEMQALIKVGADVNYVQTYYMTLGEDIPFYSTPLSCATSNNHIDVCALLVKAKADPNFSRQNYQSPLRIAVTWAQKNIAELLIETMLVTPPNEQQKLRMYTFLLCLKQMYPKDYYNLRQVFKKSLLALMTEEKSDHVYQEIKRSRIGYGDDGATKQYLIDKYFHEKKEI